MFKSSFSFLFALAVLAFAIGFAAMVRDGGEPSESEKLDSANEAIHSLTARNDELLEKMRYFSSQLEALADRQKDSVELLERTRDEWKGDAELQEATLGKIGKNQAELEERIERLSDGQEKYAGRWEEKLDVLAERFDFGDARMREIADAQEDFAALGEKIRNASTFKKVGTVDLDDIGRALSDRIETAMKNRQNLSEVQKRKLNLLKMRRSQMQRLVYDHESDPVGRPKKRELDDEEQRLADSYEKEIIELENEIGDLEIKTPSSFDGSERALQLVLEKAEKEYTVVFNQGFHGRDQRVLYHDPEISVIDLTSKIIQMIRQLPDDDPILSDL